MISSTITGSTRLPTDQFLDVFRRLMDLPSRYYGSAEVRSSQSNPQLAETLFNCAGSADLIAGSRQHGRST